jgi:hypothetical protein
MSAETQPLEVQLEDSVLAFDGRLVEEFGGGQRRGGYDERRLHVALIEKAELKSAGKRAYVQIKARGGGQIMTGGKVGTEKVAELEEFVAAVRSAAGLGTGA